MAGMMWLRIMPAQFFAGFGRSVFTFSVNHLFNHASTESVLVAMVPFCSSSRRISLSFATASFSVFAVRTGRERPEGVAILMLAHQRWSDSRK
ncbi:hypothetical protein ASE16_03635 [Leifsonia sp. Root227]|nr:hypothetical protein ASE16_03635 [Leifsonia sp. Root227]